jgi:protein-L-isoaspartate O-methyltransferase
MNQFYIIEIQQYLNGEFGHIVHFAYDADATKARLKAESKYHEVLASAAVSELPQHSATLLASDGREIMHQCYRHTVVTEPESEPETPQEEEEPVEN